MSTTKYIVNNVSGQTVNGNSIERPYKVYTALLSQSGTDAPVATILQNTLGGTPVWTRESAGNYKATLNNAFTQNKTTVFATCGGTGYGNYVAPIFGWNDVNSCILQTFDIFGILGTNADIANYPYYDFTVEIRVYP